MKESKEMNQIEIQKEIEKEIHIENNQQEIRPVYALLLYYYRRSAGYRRGA